MADKRNAGWRLRCEHRHHRQFISRRAASNIVKGNIHETPELLQEEKV